MVYYLMIVWVSLPIRWMKIRCANYCCLIYEGNMHKRACQAAKLQETKGDRGYREGNEECVNKKTKHIFEPIIGMVFDSREAARKFYDMYSWEICFGVEYNISRPASKCAAKKQAADDEADGEYRSM